MTRRTLAALAVASALVVTAEAALSPALVKALGEATYVYVQSERKSGELGRPAEIWFHWDGSAVWVGTRPTSWRVRRIRAGRSRARIAVGRPDGPAFEATGAVVKDPAAERRLMEDFARRYPDGWARHADGFRKGFASGERVLVRYTPR